MKPVGFDLNEKEFEALSVNEMLRYIIHNNKNNEDFNLHFYKELEKHKKKRRSFGSRRNRGSRGKSYT